MWHSDHCLSDLEVHLIRNLGDGSSVGSWGVGELNHSFLGAVTAVLAWAVLGLLTLVSDGSDVLDVRLEKFGDLLHGLG